MSLQGNISKLSDTTDSASICPLCTNLFRPQWDAY